MAISPLGVENEVRTYNDPDEDLEDDLLPEYHFDHSQAKPSPYIARALRRKAIILGADIAEVFTTSEQVNKGLCALSGAVPPCAGRDKAA